jgi:uncharacterized damage-inducible protein DinB
MLTNSTTSLRNLILVITILFFFCTPSFSTPPGTEDMIADWKRAKEYTKEYLDAMPADGINFKPTQDIRSFAEQMLHLAAANFGFTAAASGKNPPYNAMELEKKEELKNKEALTKVVMESYDFVIAGLGELKESQFKDKVKFFDFELTKEQAYKKVFEHQTHHRGQATIYLRLKGVKPPQEKLF